MTTPSYFDQLTFRTRMKDVLRRIFCDQPFERMLASQTQKSMQSFWWKWVPPEYLYKTNFKRSIERNGIRFELHMNDMLDHAFYFGAANRAWENFFKLMKEDFVVMDIGANTGLVTLALAAHVPKGKVYSYEPSVKNWERFKKNISLNNFENIIAQKKGLGEAHQKANLFEVERYNSGMNRILIHPNEKLNAEEIDLTTIDDEVRRLNIDCLDAIKIDVEGFEYKVLKGAVDVLKEFKPILLIEIIDRNLKLNDDGSKQVVELLFESGYCLFDATRLTSINAPIENMETDVIAVHPASSHWSSFQKIAKT